MQTACHYPPPVPAAAPEDLRADLPVFPVGQPPPEAVLRVSSRGQPGVPSMRQFLLQSPALPRSLHWRRQVSCHPCPRPPLLSAFRLLIFLQRRLKPTTKRLRK